MKRLTLGIIALASTLSFSAFSQTARVQVIHNSADLGAATVDVWLDNTLLLDDFDFRTASPFIDAPAGVQFTVGVAPSNSTSSGQAIATFDYTLAAGETYVLVAEGIVSASGYSPATPFDIAVYALGRESATNMANTDVLVHHGCTDAPTVDVVEIGAGAGTIVDDASYGDFSGYLELPTADYLLDVRDMTGMSTVATYEAPLSTLNLDGAAAVVVASGFLDPSMNSNGPAFGLYVALPTGGPLVALPQAASEARVQVIHNSADAGADVVDVWLDNTLLLDDFEFRTASPFITAPAAQQFTIGIAPSNSTSEAQSIATFDYTLTAGETYVLVAEGIVSATGYTPATPFDIAVYPMGREAASMAGNTDVLVHHGSTDAPTVDVVETGVGAGTIVDDASYGDFAGYLELATADYILDITDMSGMTTVASYEAPLSTLMLDDAAIVVVASGFLDPTMNSNGPAFGLYVALPAGGDLVALPVSTASLTDLENGSINVFPNPTTDMLNIEFENANYNKLQISDLNGRTLLSRSIEDSGFVAADVSSLTSGQYFVVLSGADGVQQFKFSKK